MPVMIQISELSLRDPDGKPLFRDLSFRLPRGEWACLVGPPERGRALLEVVCGLRRPDRGQVLVDDRNVIRLRPEKLRLLHRRLGIVLGDLGLRRRATPEGCVELKLRALELPAEEARARAHRVLSLVGLAHGGGTRPGPGPGPAPPPANGGDTRPARQRVEALDPAERRLLQLAVALCDDPVLLLLDAPLEGLSAPEQRRYLQVLEDLFLRRRLTILMTAADPKPLRGTPARLYALEPERIVPQDDPRDEPVPGPKGTKADGPAKPKRKRGRSG